MAFPKNHSATSIQDLNSRLYAVNTNTSVLPFEMSVIEPGDGEIPTHKLTWKPLGLMIHIKSRTIDDSFRTLGGVVLFPCL
jgi:hypothetical protein